MLIHMAGVTDVCRGDMGQGGVTLHTENPTWALETYFWAYHSHLSIAENDMK